MAGKTEQYSADVNWCVAEGPTHAPGSATQVSRISPDQTSPQFCVGVNRLCLTDITPTPPEWCQSKHTHTRVFNYPGFFDLFSV